MKLFRSTLTSPIFLKASSLVLGFLIWSTLSDLFTCSKWVTVPLCFYNAESLLIKAPESLSLELTGKRAHIKQIVPDMLAAHINAQTLTPGDNLLTITAQHLLMPSTIEVATVIPQSVIVHIQERN